MQLAVSAQAAGILEGLAALLAHIGSFACMLPQMVLVVRTPLEGKRAVGALEGTHTSVDLRNKRIPAESISHLSILKLSSIFEPLMLCRVVWRA